MKNINIKKASKNFWEVYKYACAVSGVILLVISFSQSMVERLTSKKAHNSLPEEWVS